MITLKIKGISVNEAYKGRRFATPELKLFKEAVGYMLPKLIIPEGKLQVFYRFGVSSKGSDYDNLIKASQDALSEKYGFNDNRIYKAEIEKIDVEKGKEFISFNIISYNEKPQAKA
jgi:Holliday junction resolvase RusA-like endonuclease